MIQSKKDGLVIAENEVEAQWFEIKQNAEQSIKIFNQRIKKAEQDLKINQREIYRKFRDGAKKSINYFKAQIEIQGELAKFADSKLKKEKV